MIFCRDCFKDITIRSIIITLNARGNCPVCGKEDAYLYDSDSNTELCGIMDELIQSYTPSSLLPSLFPMEERSTLSETLKNDWDIFSDKLNSSQIFSVVRSISPDVFESFPALFTETVGMPEKIDDLYQSEHGILKGKTWNNFVYDIKYNNRFHTNTMSTDILSKYLLYLKKDYKKGAKFFRGRIFTSNKPFSPNELNAPPSQYAVDGRANSRGISRLYIASSEETCIYEIRAKALDNISIGTFTLQKDISVLDFKMIKQISPFLGMDYVEYAINRPILLKISEEMSKSVRISNESDKLNYIPTQYLADLIKTLEVGPDVKCSGIEYASTLHPQGFNIAAFYPDEFSCTESKNYQVNHIEYKYEIMQIE